MIEIIVIVILLIFLKVHFGFSLFEPSNYQSNDKYYYEFMDHYFFHEMFDDFDLFHK